MIFLGLALALAIAAVWFYQMSGTIEDKRQKLKNHRGITRGQSAFRKKLTVYSKYAAYVAGCAAIFVAWLHFGLGL